MPSSSSTFSTVVENPDDILFKLSPKISCSVWSCYHAFSRIRALVYISCSLRMLSTELLKSNTRTLKAISTQEDVIFPASLYSVKTNSSEPIARLRRADKENGT